MPKMCLAQCLTRTKYYKKKFIFENGNFIVVSPDKNGAVETRFQNRKGVL